MNHAFACRSVRAVSGILALLAHVSCSGTQPAAPTSPSSPLSLTGAVTLGENVPSVQLTLRAGSQDVTNAATWQSSNTAVATVSYGLVRATGPGTATISATYQQQTVSASVPVVQDQDCIPYDPTGLAIVEETRDVPPSWTVTSPFSLGVESLAGADNIADATRLLALFQRYNQQCFIGRSNARPNRYQYIVTYFKGAGILKPAAIAPEDCVAYNASALQVVSQGSNGWALMGGGTQLALLDTQFEAGLLSAIASQYSNECFVGRGNTRPNPYGYITEYWK